MLPRRLDPSGVEAGGESGGERYLTRTWGGVSGKQWRGCQAPRLHFSLPLFGFFVLERTTRTAPAERERTGATPLFRPLARSGERGGVSPGVRHRVRHSPRRSGGRSRLNLSLQEGSPARERVGRRAATQRLVLADRRRHVLAVRAALAGCVPRRRSRGRSRTLPHDVAPAPARYASQSSMSRRRRSNRSERA